MSCSHGVHRRAHVVVVFLRHTEADWSDFDKAEGTKAYIKSKTLAERAADPDATEAQRNRAEDALAEVEAQLEAASPPKRDQIPAPP